MPEKSDSELVELVRQGHKEAFGELVERYEIMAKSIARRLVGQEEIARELVQEAMLQAYLSLDSLREAARFKSWFYGLVLNVCRNHRRSQKFSTLSWEALAGGVRFEALPFAQILPGPQQIAEERELHRLVLAAVNSLSPKNRAATLLFYYEELTLPEISAILGISQVAVKGRLHKSRLELKTRLLPLLPEYSPPAKVQPDIRSSKMIKVTIADVVWRENEQGGQTVVVLFDEAGKRLLPIWVGRFEGEAIALGLQKLEMPRPLTFSFMAKLLEISGVKLEEVQISALTGDTFYATVKINGGGKTQELDARPSDAMALAVQTGSPIYVSEEVMTKAGLDISEEIAKTIPNTENLQDVIKDVQNPPDKLWLANLSSGKGAHNITREIQEKFDSRVSKPLTEEDKSKVRQELVSFIFGGLN